jgi:hypothetical protein
MFADESIVATQHYITRYPVMSLPAMANIPGTGVGYTLVLPVTEFTLRQDFEDTRLSVNKRNIWAVVPAGGDGRRLSVATTQSTDVCIPSDHDVEHEDVPANCSAFPVRTRLRFRLFVSSPPIPASGCDQSRHRPMNDAAAHGVLTQLFRRYPGSSAIRLWNGDTFSVGAAFPPSSTEAPFVLAADALYQ